MTKLYQVQEFLSDLSARMDHEQEVIFNLYNVIAHLKCLSIAYEAI